MHHKQGYIQYMNRYVMNVSAVWQSVQCVPPLVAQWLHEEEG